ncbi:hypothetical protein [Pseudoclavibacter sp. VKM Ac-2888]|uniref:hypothetical protein n=1 Tax=Pseudoclavibacter sp. VKM Ac-2888 TaxID=2783830 RepID=UPI00188CCC7F|nr:hypothetical protein [Pseudoclavibacter sp. VKM Ac-2888]MBF4552224.1 hypothetical protein [Pseudoclavibacter sp. VKM Ac-2888]
MTFSHGAAPERTRSSPWLYVALGVVLVAALAVLGFFFGGALLTQATSRAAETDETVTVGSDESAVAVVAPAGWVIVPHYFGTDVVTLRSPDARLEITLQVPSQPQSMVDASEAAAGEASEALAEDGLVPEGAMAADVGSLFWIDEVPKEGLSVRHASYEYGQAAAEGQGAPGVMVGSAAVASAGATSPNAAVRFSASADDLDRYRPAIAQILETIGGSAA